MSYRQCRLERDSYVDVAWIPERYAKLGQVLGFKREGQWTEGWHVTAVYGRLSDDAAPSGRDEYRYHREVTDR